MTMFSCTGRWDRTLAQFEEEWRAQRAWMHRPDRPQPTFLANHLFEHLMTHRCTNFNAFFTGHVETDETGNSFTPMRFTEMREASCNAHPGARTEIVGHIAIPAMVKTFELTGRWVCPSCHYVTPEGITGEATAREFTLHLNQRDACLRFLCNSIRWPLLPIPLTMVDNLPLVNWLVTDYHDIDDQAEPWTITEDHDGDDDDDFEFEPEPDADPDDDDEARPQPAPGQGMVFPEDMHVQPATPGFTETFNQAMENLRNRNIEVREHVPQFDDTNFPPVTTGDGRYLRFNVDTQRYEEARRPAATMHDIFG